jgi:dTDP-4-amino-4,6-dideoxygalactose transaminase
MFTARQTLALQGGRPVRTEPLPLHHPSFDGSEIEAAAACLRAGDAGGNGPWSRDLESALARRLGIRRVLATSSCTSALEAALLACGIGPGDEVIVPSFTFVTTANAVVRAGARPVFVDIEPRYCTMDPALVEAAVGPRTKAIVPMHYAGMACRIDELKAVCARRGLLMIEDAAHALNAAFDGRPLGTWGDAGCFSFHQTKDLVCGEGGAVAVASDDALAARLEIVREKGTDRSAFLRGEREKYTWVAAGSSYVLADILAAVAVAQLAKLDGITRRKTELAERLLERLAPLAPRVAVPGVPPRATPNWHLFAVRVEPAQRDWVIQALRAEGIGAAFHYVPLHSSPYAVETFGPPADLPVTDRVAASLLRLPLHASMTARDCEDVANAVEKVLEWI